MLQCRTLLIALSIAAASAPAFAQEPAAEAVATLQVASGPVMASTGGEFATVPAGTALASGDRVMLADGSSATLVYPNGCRQMLTVPGVYVVDDTCTPTPGADEAGVADTQGALIITGIAAVAAGALISMEDSDGAPPPPPVSR